MKKLLPFILVVLSFLTVYATIVSQEEIGAVVNEALDVLIIDIIKYAEEDEPFVAIYLDDFQSGEKVLMLLNKEKWEEFKNLVEKADKIYKEKLK